MNVGILFFDDWRGGTMRSVFFLLLLGLLLASSVAAGLLVDRGFLVYGDTSGVPRYRTWNGSLSDELNAQNTNSNVEWVELARHPFQRQLSLVTLEDKGGTSSDTVTFQLWNGTVWNSLTQVGSDSDVNYHGLDVAYEKSGRALVVYTDNDQAGIRYRVLNGVLGSEQIAPVVNSGVIRTVLVESSPVENELLMVTEDSTNDINFYSWDSVAWSNPIEIMNDSWGVFQTMAIGYERVSGDALVVYGDDDDDTPYYRLWTTANNSLSQEYVAPTLNDPPTHIRLASHPTTDELVLATFDSDGDTFVLVWNGTHWGNALQVGFGLVGLTNSIAVAYEQTTGRALVVYDIGTTSLKYNVWDGSSWSGQGSIANGADAPQWIELGARPFSREIMLMSGDVGSDVNAFVWNGSNWTSLGELQTNGFSILRGGLDTEYLLLNDTVAPFFVNVSESPMDPVYYNVTTSYLFTITPQDDVGLSSVTLTFQGSSVSPVVSGGVYSYTPSSLAAGTYTYTWTANDTSGNINSTTLTYTVLPVPAAVNLTLDGTSGNVTVQQNSNISFVGTLVNGTGVVNLTVDGVVEASAVNTVTLMKNFTVVGAHPVTLLYYGDQTTLASNVTYVVMVTVFQVSGGSSGGSSGSGEGGSSPLGIGASPNTGAPEIGSKYRSGEAPVTGQAVRSGVESSGVVSPSSPPSTGGGETLGSSPLTGLAVAPAEGKSSIQGALQTLLGAFLKPSAKDVGVLLVLVLLGVLIVDLYRRIQRGQSLFPRLYFGTLRADDSVALRQRHHYVQTLSQMHRQHHVREHLDRVNKVLIQQMPSSRKVNIEHIPVPEKISRRQQNDVLRELKEVFKLE